MGLMSRKLGRRLIRWVAWAGLIAVACSGAAVTSASLALKRLPRCRTTASVAGPAQGSSGVRGLRHRPAIPAITWNPHTDSDQLSKLDPLTLRPRSRIVDLGNQQIHATAVSPGGRWIAVSHTPKHGRAQVSVFGSRSLRLRRTIMTGALQTLTWPSPHLLLGVHQVPGVRRARVVIERLDPVGGRVIERQTFMGNAMVLPRSLPDGSIVVPLAPPTGIGPMALVWVDAEGGVRTATLDRVDAGFDWESAVSPLSTSEPRYVAAGVAVDPGGHRAFVTAPGDPVAVVSRDEKDGSLDVDYDVARGAPSLFERLVSWVVPPAFAKFDHEWGRKLSYLGHNLLAVSGSSQHPQRGSTVYYVTKTRGLDVIDTRTWQGCRFSDVVDSVWRLKKTFLAWTTLPLGWRKGTGLSAYNFAGERVWHILGRRILDYVEVVRGLVYVEYGSNGRRNAVVDPRSGKVLNVVRSVPARFLTRSDD